MIIFWIVCAVMVAIALAFVLPPLMDKSDNAAKDSSQEANVAVYRDQISELKSDLNNGLISSEQFQHDKDEIERRLLEDVTQPTDAAKKQTRVPRNVAYAVMAAIPVLAVAMYVWVGNSSAINAQAQPGVASEPMPAREAPAGPMSQQRIEANVASLAQRLEQNPNDFQGWTMLGRSYVTLEKYREASDAYAKASVLRPNDPDLMADYAFTLAMANDRRFEGQPNELIKKALKLDPENPKVLELAGSAAFAAKDYQQAVNYWQKLLDKTPPGSELAQSISERINHARSLAKQ